MYPLDDATVDDGRQKEPRTEREEEKCEEGRCVQQEDDAEEGIRVAAAWKIGKW